MRIQLDPSTAAVAQPWSILAGDLGRLLIFLALLASLVAIVAWLMQPRASGKRGEALEKVGKLAFTTANLSFFGSFACLAALFVRNQFQYEYVFKHSAKDHELQYLIAGVWSGQEGSVLLWACTTALFGLLAVGRTGHYRRLFSIVFSTL
nr:hypothetical protein [Fimbriimonadaceae bacterium]